MATTEEVEALVAAQMACLPDWWEKQRALEHDIDHDRRPANSHARRTPSGIRVFRRRRDGMVRVSL